MLFSKKNSRDDELLQNSVLIEKSASQIDFLISLAEGRQEIISKLKEAGVRIKYFGPTLIKSASALDKKIENRIGDIKIALSKAKVSNNYAYSNELIDGLLLLAAERRSITA